MKLIAGLGNPGLSYFNTRHNIGFEVIDKLCGLYNINMTSQHKALMGIGMIDDIKIILAKPQTYMNLSGECVRDFVLYFHIDIRDILVIYDDMDLDVGVLRLREKGSAGGHNGIKNIIDHLKTNEFRRVRVGISKDKDKNTIDSVLGKFKEDEKKVIDEKIEKIANLIEDFVKYDFNKVMSMYNG